MISKALYAHVLTALIGIYLLIYPIGNVFRFTNIPNMPPVLVLDVVLGVLAMLFIIKHVRKPTIPHRLITYPMIFVFCATFSLLFNVFQYPAYVKYQSFLYLLRFMVYALCLYVPFELSKHQKVKVTPYFIASGALLLCGGFLQYFLYPDLRNLFYAGWDEHYYRMFGTFFDPNFFGAIIVMWSVLLLHPSTFIHTYFKTLTVKKKGVWLLLVSITFTAVLLTYSRSTYLMLCAIVIAYILYTKSVKILLIFCAIFIGGLFILPKSFGGEGLNLLRTQSVNARIVEYEQALDVWSDHKVFGVGYNAYGYEQSKRGYIEEVDSIRNNSASGVPNSYLLILVTTGIIGLSAFILMWYSSLNYWLKKNEVVMVLITVGLLIHGLFENTLLYPFILSFYFLISGWRLSQLHFKMKSSS